jgi:hypothetical protein
MLCCVGLIGGAAVGQYLGGPWTVVAPAAGFAIGLVADMKFMGHMHHGAGRPPAAAPREREPQDELSEVKPAPPAARTVDHRHLHEGGIAMRFLILSLLLAAVAVGVAACGERPQTALYENGKYRGKTDTRPWDNAPAAYGAERWAKGDEQSWAVQIRTRHAGQNEYRRIGH